MWNMKNSDGITHRQVPHLYKPFHAKGPKHRPITQIPAKLVFLRPSTRMVHKRVSLA